MIGIIEGGVRVIQEVEVGGMSKEGETQEKEIETQEVEEIEVKNQVQKGRIEN